MVLREKFFLLVALLFTSVCLTASLYVGYHQQQIRSALSRHGFDRTFVIGSEQVIGTLSAAQTAHLFNNPPNFADGELALLSRPTAKALHGLTDVEVVMPIARSNWKLTVQGVAPVDVKVFHVPSVFFEQFHLGPPGALTTDAYVLSPSLQSILHLQGSTRATLGLTSDDLASIDPDFSQHVDASKLSVAVTVRPEVLQLPGGSGGVFDLSMFSARPPQKIEVPNLLLFPKVFVIVKIREGADLAEAERRLKTLAAQGRNADGEHNLLVMPISTYFAAELKVDFLDTWYARIKKGLYIASGLLVLMLLLLRYRRFRREILLRQALGARLPVATWLSMKSSFHAVALGIALACGIAYVGCLLTNPGLLPAVTLVSGAMIMAVVMIFILLYGTVYFLGRKNLFVQLNDYR